MFSCFPAQPAYQSGSVPSYGSSSLIAAAPEPPVTAVPAYTTAPPPPAYYKPATTTTARPTYQQPPISSKPFTVFGSQAQSTYTQPPAYIIPKIEAVYEPIGKPGNFPKFNSLPGFDGQTYLEPKPPAYEAAASYASPKKTVAPSTQQLQQQQQQRTKSILKPGETVPGSIPGNGGPSDNTDSNSDTGLSSLHSSSDEGTYVLDTLV